MNSPGQEAMPGRKIAFYAPLKSPDHPVPSGDRQMARLLINCLVEAGYQVEIASRCRAFLKDSLDASKLTELKSQANVEIQRLAARWQTVEPPALWFCYHPYYKSPDLIGPRLCDKFNIPMITAEASYSARRNTGIWSQTQRHVLRTVNRAAVNICFTHRDEVGLREVSEQAKLVRLKPFIDTSEFPSGRSNSTSTKFVSVAMMRSGDKMLSYRHLARSLTKLLHLSWSISIVGDGVMRSEVRRLFGSIPQDRVQWHGEMSRDSIAQLFSQCTLYLWPGCGEAYGLAYIEAQTAGLPVVAFKTAGVADVVYDKKTGVLTPAGDDDAYARAIAQLLDDPDKIKRFSINAQSQARNEHSLSAASNNMSDMLKNSLQGW